MWEEITRLSERQRTERQAEVCINQILKKIKEFGYVRGTYKSGELPLVQEDKQLDVLLIVQEIPHIASQSVSRKCY